MNANLNNALIRIRLFLSEVTNDEAFLNHHESR